MSLRLSGLETGFTPEASCESWRSVADLSFDGVSDQLLFVSGANNLVVEIAIVEFPGGYEGLQAMASYCICDLKWAK